MRKIFDHLQEKSPVMKASKMERAMQLLGLNPTPAQVCDVLHRVGQPVVLDFEAFGQAMKEAQASWSKSAEAQAEELRKCFEDFDPEKKGFLPRSTIAKIMSIDSGFFSEKQLEDMLRGVPLTSDGYRYSDLIEKLLDEEALSSDVSEGSDQNESGFGEERGKAQLERQLAEVREDHQEQSEMMQATLREELAEARQAKEAAEAKLREELAEARQAKEAAQALAEEKAKLLAEEATLREELAEARQAKEAAQVMCGGLASIAVLGGFTDAALLLWCFTQFRFPVLVVLHLLYSAIFAKMVMPIFTIHVGFVSRSELAKDYKNDEFWVLVNQETGMSTSVKDLDVEDYNEAFDADLFTYDSSRNPWDQGWHRNCFNFWCKTRWSPEQLGDF